MIFQAKNPVILAGSGVVRGHASKELTEFATKLKIPVINTMMAKGIIPMDDKYSLWTIGIPQKDYVNQLFDRVDPYSVLFYLLFVVFIFEQVLLLSLFCNKLSKIKSRTLYCYAQFIRP